MDALTTRSTLARGELIYSPISVEKSIHVRDALVKGIYGRVFISIVEKINAAIYTPSVSKSVSCTFDFHNQQVREFFLPVDCHCELYMEKNVQYLRNRVQGNPINSIPRDDYDQPVFVW